MTSGAADPNLLAKLAASLARPPADDPTSGGSLLAVSAQSYGARPDQEDVTIPTGFDPRAAALFEAVVEAALLVSKADGEFDEGERAAFESVVVQATGSAVDARQIEALVADFSEMLAEDGLDTRVQHLGRTVSKPQHQREVLRIASLLAFVSGGVSDVERDVLSKIAGAFSLGDDAVKSAVEQAERALSA